MLRLRNPFGAPPSPGQSGYRRNNSKESDYKDWRIPSSPRGSWSLNPGLDQSDLSANVRCKWCLRSIFLLLTCLGFVAFIILIGGGPLGTSWVPSSLDAWKPEMPLKKFDWRRFDSSPTKKPLRAIVRSEAQSDSGGRSSHHPNMPHGGKAGPFGSQGMRYGHSDGEVRELRLPEMREALKARNAMQHNRVAVEFPHVEVLITGGHLSGPHFIQMHSDRSDSAWDSLIPRGKGYVSLASEKYEIALVKQLKCLATIRDALLAGKVPLASMRCLDYIRQTVMCAGDLTLELVLHERVGASIESSGIHKCKDWDTVKKWIEQNASDSTY